MDKSISSLDKEGNEKGRPWATVTNRQFQRNLLNILSINH